MVEPPRLPPRREECCAPSPPRPIGAAGRRPRPSLAFPLLAVLLGALPGTGAHAAPADPASALCGAAIASADPATHLPPLLLSAIGVVESGRADPASGAVTPWPWTINIAGIGQTFATRADAIAAVEAAQQSGVQSIDVGCMQVNLFYHPRAFATLAEAFDPAANVGYAARFLEALHARAGEWPAAIAAYHSLTPERGAAYARRVAASWPLAARFGLDAWAAARTSAAALEAEVDPDHVLTPEFRARMVEAAAFRHQRDARAAPARPPAGQPSGTAAIEAKVDPRHVLTAEFRARLVAAAVFRQQRDAARRAPSPARDAGGAQARRLNLAANQG